MFYVFCVSDVKCLYVWVCEDVHVGVDACVCMSTSKAQLDIRSPFRTMPHL